MVYVRFGFVVKLLFLFIVCLISAKTNAFVLTLDTSCAYRIINKRMINQNDECDTAFKFFKTKHFNHEIRACKNKQTP